ncbi:hypothetical protein ABW19_dt0202063 [Dactylella cylindrospora]|nr:hypothetical protein ABW19_dt0202063 [Dactylella cylindrospora]
MLRSSVIAALLLTPVALAQSQVWGQCGGIGWTGPTTCVSGSTCVKQNDYYSQCLPSSDVTTSTTTTTTSRTTTRSSTTSSRTTTTSSRTTTTTAGSTGSTGCAQAADSGFATLNGGTRGGQGGTVVEVTTQADLVNYASASGKYIIKVRGRISMSPKGYEVSVASDKTIIGVGSNAEIYQGGFNVVGVQNVIIRNLKIGNTYDGVWEGKENDWDAIKIESSKNIWVDHCLLERGEDGLFDSRFDCEYVTFSWNVLQNHNKAIGIGWTENVITQMTLHHNYLLNLGTRCPSGDNLKYAHLYNNYLNNCTSYGHYSRGYTNMRVENCYFEKTKNPLQVDSTAILQSVGNKFVSCTGTTSGSGTSFNPTSFYSYSLDGVDNVPSIVKSGAGPKASICS